MSPGSAPALEYVHVDVFSPVAYGGNSLPVFLDARGLSPGQMRLITRELRHFEAIFLEATADPRTVRARVFDLIDELPFAGHPVIGAAAALHHAAGGADRETWHVELPGSRVVTVTTERTAAGGWFGLLDQGAPEFLGGVSAREEVARAFGLRPDDLDPALPLEVVSTGLRYLIVPVRPEVLARARIVRDLTGMLQPMGAEFAVLFDEAALEVRHWNNDGMIEDVATGSAAGTIGAYRLRHARARGGETFALHQGRYAGRPSRLLVQPAGEPGLVRRVLVGGEVSLIGRGLLEVLPVDAG